jgi:membrane peptidoglycan carboxypeptidase
MQALRTAFFGSTFKTTTAAAPAQSGNATRQVTCMAKKKASVGQGRMGQAATCPSLKQRRVATHCASFIVS